jgi:uncharacterized protein YndB with AHSA1/START domain
MAHETATVIVNRPIGEVFAFLADGMNEPAWRPGVTDVSHVAETGTAVGATFKQTMKGPGGRSIPGDYRITRYEQPTRLDFEVIAGPARPAGRFDLRETAGATEVTFTQMASVSGWLAALERRAWSLVAGRIRMYHFVTGWVQFAPHHHARRRAPLDLPETGALIQAS